jgi:hypothetical protein
MTRPGDSGGSASEDARKPASRDRTDNEASEDRHMPSSPDDTFVESGLQSSLPSAPFAAGHTRGEMSSDSLQSQDVLTLPAAQEVKARAETFASNLPLTPALQLDDIWQRDLEQIDDIQEYVKERSTTMSFPEKVR